MNISLMSNTERLKLFKFECEIFNPFTYVLVSHNKEEALKTIKETAKIVDEWVEDRDLLTIDDFKVTVYDLDQLIVLHNS